MKKYKYILILLVFILNSDQIYNNITQEFSLYIYNDSFALKRGDFEKLDNFIVNAIKYKNYDITINGYYCHNNLLVSKKLIEKKLSIVKKFILSKNNDKDSIIMFTVASNDNNICGKLVKIIANYNY